MPEYTAVACFYCGKKKHMLLSDKEYTLRKHPDHKFYCDVKCQTKARPAALFVTEKCSMCGAEFSLEASTARARRKKNGGAIYCSIGCGSLGAAAKREKARRDALASGQMECTKCKRTLPLAEFRVWAAPGRCFPYMSVCKSCTPTDWSAQKRASGVTAPRMAKKLYDIRLREAGIPEDEALTLDKCDHTPVEGACVRAPDWRMLLRPDAAEYKWSCRICGFSYKEYDRAKDCCEPKGVCKGNRFFPFARSGQEATGPAHTADARAEGCGG